MMTNPELIDRAALMRNRARARRAPELFLHHDVADETEERLEEVNRTFTDIAVVTSFPDVWHPRLPSAKIIEDADVLDLTPASHDLIIHHLCLHWANDPVGQLIQCLRALRPDGLLICTMFGGQTLHELRAALAEAEIAETGGISPRVIPMGEMRDLGALLQRAGFALPVADNSPRTVTYENALRLMQDLRAMGETNALTARHKRTPPRGLFARAAMVYTENFGQDGRIPATFDVVTLTGWSPHESQQKPLRPGSAVARLAEALNTEENALTDDE